MKLLCVASFTVPSSSSLLLRQAVVGLELVEVPKRPLHEHSAHADLEALILVKRREMLGDTPGAI